MFPVSVTRVFKTASVVKRFFSKETGEIAAFYSFVENSVTSTALSKILSRDRYVSKSSSTIDFEKTTLVVNRLRRY